MPSDACSPMRSRTSAAEGSPSATDRDDAERRLLAHALTYLRS